jgi:hypothetical protein
MQKILFIVTVLLIPALCLNCRQGNLREVTIHSNNNELRIKLVKGDTSYLQCFVKDSLTCSWPLAYPVFEFQAGDVNHDGIDDLAVGVIKKTRHDRVKRKRLFLFEVRNNAIIPLWLGSRLSHPLENFALVKKDSSTLVRAIEQEQNGQFLIAEYEWQGFGLRFRKYVKRNVTLESANEMLGQ